MTALVGPAASKDLAPGRAQHITPAARRRARRSGLRARRQSTIGTRVRSARKRVRQRGASTRRTGATIDRLKLDNSQFSACRRSSRRCDGRVAPCDLMSHTKPCGDEGHRPCANPRRPAGARDVTAARAGDRNRVALGNPCKPARCAVDPPFERTVVVPPERHVALRPQCPDRARDEAGPSRPQPFGKVDARGFRSPGSAPGVRMSPSFPRCLRGGCKTPGNP